MKERKYFFPIIAFIIVQLLSCGVQRGNVVISKPDVYRGTFEAKEEIVLRAVAGIFKDKQMGRNVTINRKKRTVKTDYLVRGDWRTKSTAQVKKLNWKECEVVFLIVTEKKTETGWEMRRLLEKEQYSTLFDAIELRIYEEMAKIE